MEVTLHAPGRGKRRPWDLLSSSPFISNHFFLLAKDDRKLVGREPGKCSLVGVALSHLARTEES